MSNDKIYRAVGIFPNRRDLDKALYELKDYGFLPQQIFAGGYGDRDFNNAVEVGFSIDVASKFADTAKRSARQSELGILDDKIKVYLKKLKQNEYLLVIEGNKDEIIIVDRILRSRKLEAYKVDPSNYSDRSRKDNLSKIKSTRKTALIRQTIVVLSALSDVATLLEKFQKKSFPFHQIDVIGKDVPRSPPFDGIRVSDRLNQQAISIPRSSLWLYNARSERGEYLVVVTSFDTDTNVVLALLEKNGIRDWQIYYQQVPEDDKASDRLNAIVVENGLTHKNNRG
jgi:hypothetical protein